MLSAGSVLAAIACAALALVQGPVTLLIAWPLAGVAMAATLYDPAFATLHDVAGSAYRRSRDRADAVRRLREHRVLAVVPGVARHASACAQTFGIYAVMHLLICLPLHWWFVPADRSAPISRPIQADVAASSASGGRAFLWLASALTLVSLIASALAAHLIGLLTAAGSPPAKRC